MIKRQRKFTTIFSLRETKKTSESTLSPRVMQSHETPSYIDFIDCDPISTNQ